MSSIVKMIQERASLMRGVRLFFEREDFLEVETPIRLPAPCLEDYIDAIPAGDQFLRTSPELHMKRLVCAGMEKIFTVGACFRDGEFGRLHNPEYTMLEWYRSSADYDDILSDMKALLDSLGFSIAKYHEFTVSAAFLKFAGWDPVTDFDEERFEQDLLDKVEPAFDALGAVVLRDYPHACAALARRRGAIAERWELYLDGVEVANAYSELTDPAEQRARFGECAQKRAARGAPVYPLDEDFLVSLDAGMPPTGGVAVGIDRLIMLRYGHYNLDKVILFREGVFV